MMRILKIIQDKPRSGDIIIEKNKKTIPNPEGVALFYARAKAHTRPTHRPELQRLGVEAG